MRINLQHILAFVFLICCTSIHSQQEYRLQHYGGPGTIYLYNKLPGIIPVPEITESGANVVWDVSLNAMLNTNPRQIVTPGQGIDQATFVTICTLSGLSFIECISVWGQTEQALLSHDSIGLFGFALHDLQRYQNKTSNLLLENFFGFTVDFGGMPTQGVIVYQQPDTIFNFPIVYNKSWTSMIEWTLDLNALGIPIVYESRQSRSTTVDAWGTVMTPYDTFTNVVRLRSEIVHRDSLFTDSIDVPINLTQVEYMWFDTAYKLPVMIATGIITDTLEIINMVEYIYEATCPNPLWTVDVESQVFYLNSSDNVTVDFEITNSNAGLYEWDFDDGTIVTSTGNISHTYTAAGDYEVVVTGCMTHCLPLNSCSSQTINFQVVDTISSVVVVPGNELGIEIYPNPANKFFTIELPDGLGFEAYQIYDMTGRKISAGSLKDGINVINSSGIDSGMYSVHLSGITRGKRQAVIRFVVSK